PLTGQYMISDRRGDLWVGSAFNVGLLHIAVDPATSRAEVRRMSDERGIFDKLALALLEDSDGNIWVGTSGGLLRVSQPRARLYSGANGLPDDNVRAIERTSGGDLWLGPARGLARMPPHGMVEPPPIPGLTARAVTSLHADSLGRLLIGFADT